MSGVRTSRRGLLTLGGAAIAGAAATGALAGCDDGSARPAAAAAQKVAFYGAHQAGIATPAPARPAFAT